VIVLGLDPGTAALGYGIIERTKGGLRSIDYGCFRTESTTPLPLRLREIHDHVVDLMALHAPDLVAVERLFFSRNAQTAFAVGQARGVVLLAAAERSLDVREATPNEVKVATAGHGSAEKEQVQRMVQAILGLPELPVPDDAADALAVAIWAANTERSGVPPEIGRLDRSAVTPGGHGQTPFERSVRDALRRERIDERGATVAAASRPRRPR
jgi:crossover junction endodeoxyribonuclease RuvC